MSMDTRKNMPTTVIEMPVPKLPGVDVVLKSPKKKKSIFRRLKFVLCGKDCIDDTSATNSVTTTSSEGSNSNSSKGSMVKSMKDQMSRSKKLSFMSNYTLIEGLETITVSEKMKSIKVFDANFLVSLCITYLFTGT